MSNSADVEAKFKRVKTIREAMESIKEKRSKLEGEISGSNKRLKELTKECTDKYSVDINALPALIKQLDAEAEESLRKAEEILNPTP
jgi:predicted  nucleic acid-binding Zn-ribbon protein